MYRIAILKTYLIKLTKIRNNILLRLLSTNLKNLKFIEIYTIKNSILLYLFLNFKNITYKIANILFA